MCTYLSLGGSPGTLRAPLCVRCTLCSFATESVIGFVVLCLCSNGTSTCRKYLLAPKFNIAHFLMFMRLMLNVEVRPIGGFMLGLANFVIIFVPLVHKYHEVWRFLCLSEKLLSEWSWFLTSYFCVVLWLFGVGIGQKSYKHKVVVIHISGRPYL